MNQKSNRTVLYWYWSFNPQKVRLALTELGVEFELRTVDLLKGENRSDDFLAVNSLGRVPVFKDDEITLLESNAILVWLGEKYGKLWPERGNDKAEAARWLFFESRHLSDHVGRLWFNDFVMPQIGREADSDATSAAAAALPKEIEVVEQQLSTNDFMLASGFSLVDCCYGPVMDALSLSRFSLDDYPGVRAYLDRVRGRDAWAACEFKTAGSS